MKPVLKRGFPEHVDPVKEPRLFQTGLVAMALAGKNVVVQGTGSQPAMTVIMTHAKWFPDYVLRGVVDLVLNRLPCPDECIPATAEDGLAWHVRAAGIVAVAGFPGSEVKRRDSTAERASKADTAQVAKQLNPFVSVDIHGVRVEDTLRKQGLNPHQVSRALMRLEATDNAQQ